MFYWLAKNVVEAFMIAAESDRRQTPCPNKPAAAPVKQPEKTPAKGRAAAAFPGACRYGLPG